MSEPIFIRSGIKANWNETTKIMLVEPKKKKPPLEYSLIFGFILGVVTLHNLIMSGYF